MMVNVREAGVTDHAFLERMCVEAALGTRDWATLLSPSMKPGIVRSMKPGRGSTTVV
jgi:hypothetical protein